MHVPLRIAFVSIFLLSALSLAACSGHQTPEGIARPTVFAIAANDYAGATSMMDDALKAKVTKDTIKAQADALAQSGSISLITPTQEINGEYEYDVSFGDKDQHFHMTLDADGLISSYSFTPN